MADRKVFTSVFEETEEVIRARMLANAALTAWRKEPGDFIYDAIAPDSAEIQQLQIGLDTALRDTHAQYAEGDALDAILSSIGITRNAATPNQRGLLVTADAGVIIPKGQALLSVVLDTEGNPLQYTTDAATTFTALLLSQVIPVTCSAPGLLSNISTGSQFVMVSPIPGVRSIVDQGTTISGTDTETDDAAFKRYDFKVNNPDTGGNKSDLKRWAEEVTGVGSARVIPRWAGNLTTKVIITGEDMTPGSPLLVSTVQDYMDPGSEGLGEGKAPAGNRVTVASATGLTLDVEATATYYSGVSPGTVLADFMESLQDYLAQIAFTDASVSIAKVGSLLISTYGVSNYTGLLLNGAGIDIAVDMDEIAIVGTVTL